MGRYRTGIYTTDQSLKVDLSYLLKSGILKKNHSYTGSLSWHTPNDPDLGSIQIQTRYTDKEAWIRMVYTNTNIKSGVATRHDYKVYLERVKSNLGKGEVLYMICPESGQRCRILYCAYGSQIWKSREAYTHRIYYGCQAVSKLEYSNTRYWDIDYKQEKTKRQKLRKQTQYKGQPTKRYIKTLQTDVKKQLFDIERWELTSMGKAMRKAMATGWYDDMIPRY